MTQITVKPAHMDHFFDKNLLLPITGPMGAGLPQQLGAQFKPKNPRPLKIEMPGQFQNFDKVMGCTWHYVWKTKESHAEETGKTTITIAFGVLAAFRLVEDCRLAKDWLDRQNQKAAELIKS